jgi:hypothetical protein
MNESIDFRLKKRILHSIYALIFLGALLLLSVVLENWTMIRP